MVTKRLLVIAHQPSSNLKAMVKAILTGARAEEVDNVEVRLLAPLGTGAEEVLAADGLILLTPENLGYMSGALKDFFDRSYYALIDKTDALPYATVIRAGNDGTGTRRAVESICGGLKWRAVQAPLLCRGEWQDGFLEDCRELGMVMALGLQEGLF
jgi:multimeric flavodoxin WrbA